MNNKSKIRNQRRGLDLEHTLAQNYTTTPWGFQGRPVNSSIYFFNWY